MNAKELTRLVEDLRKDNLLDAQLELQLAAFRVLEALEKLEAGECKEAKVTMRLLVAEAELRPLPNLNTALHRARESNAMPLLDWAA